jgi:putative CocE/NonD family hydrolase
MSRTLLALQLRWAVLLLVSIAAATRAQEVVEPESYLRLNYEKREVQIPMRDGVKLFTAIYSPRDTTRKYPLLMIRTPYGVKPYGVDKYPASLGPSMLFAREGYIFVYQDVRGRYMSEGKFEHVTPHIAVKSARSAIDESSDTSDTIEWLLSHVPNHNGRVGQWGISYPGFYAAAGMIDAHPALRAVSPQAPVADWFFDDFFHHGAFYLAHAFQWLSANSSTRKGPTMDEFTQFKYPTRDGYKFYLDIGPVKNADKLHLKNRVEFWKQIMQHPNRDDFWKRRNILPHLRNVAPAVMVVTGWYDAEDLYGSFSAYRHLEQQNPGVNNVLVVGPWYHGGWARGDGENLGAVAFGSKTAAFYRQHLELPFFNKYLKDANVPPLPEATVFETGGNRWRTFDAWPPRQASAKTIYAHGGGKLSFEPPQEGKPAFAEFISDPHRPVPYTETMSSTMTREHMIDDQRFAARRPDVLVFQSDVLQQDLTLAGRIQADLWVSTSARDADKIVKLDSDWIVKLIDVFPDDFPSNPFTPAHQTMSGYQMLVRSEVIRGRFRNSYERPEPFTPNQPAKVSVVLQDVLHRFAKGHRLMIQLQSTWFPLVDRNPQKYVDNIFMADEEDFIKATHRVFHTPQQPTRFTLPVLGD